MVKFILVVITIVFVGLAYYVNIGKDDSNVKSVVKKEVSTLPVEQPLRKVKKDVSKDATSEKQVVKENAIKKPTKTVEKNVVKSDGETNEDLTLESIENADVSDEEKERMIDELAYSEIMNREPSELLSDDEVLKMIEEDFKAGRI